MAVEIEKLSDLSADDVAQQSAILTELFQEATPTLYLKRGVLHDLLLHWSAVMGTKNQTEAVRLRQSMSVNAILADPTLADDEVVNNIASNYRVTRQAGGFSGGSVEIILDILSDLTIAVGSIFEAQGKLFVTEEVFTGRISSAAVISDSDRLISDRGDGTYSFRIVVAATEVGEASQLIKGTALVPEKPPRNFVAAIAAEDFIGGISEEQNQELINRFANGMSTKTMSARANMTANLREQFPEVAHDSLIGFGDAEMTRDRHSIFPVSFGGRADWYVQTQPLGRSYGQTVEATLMEKTGDGLGIWQIVFDRDDYPGLYSVAVAPTDDDETSFTVESIIRSTDNSEVSSNDGFVPEIREDLEAAFTRFQVATIRFKDTVTSVGGLTVGTSKKDYKVTIKAMPSIAEIQDYFSQRSARCVSGDVLVKAPVPCFVGFSAKILLIPGQSEPTASLIADDLAELVNHWGFTGRLPSSALLDVIHNHLDSGAVIEDIGLTGRIEYPDGTFVVLHDNEVLEIPYEPEKFVTSRTTLFFLDPADVQLDISTADMLPV